MNVTKIEDEINDIEKQLLKIDTLINKNNDIDKDNIEKINSLNKRLLLIKINIDKYKLNNNLTHTNHKLHKKIKYLDHNISLLNQFVNMSADYKSSKSLDKLTILNTIFLPLGLICSYFGMNFKSMGSPTGKKGILTINNSNSFVLLLFVISIIITIIILLI